MIKFTCFEIDRLYGMSCKSHCIYREFPYNTCPFVDIQAKFAEYYKEQEINNNFPCGKSAKKPTMDQQERKLAHKIKEEF